MIVSASPPSPPPQRPNVLYAVAHDLRHDLSSPAVRSIASDRGCQFALAFAQAPYCAPSRNSFFTGRRCTATGVHTFDKRDAREFAPLIRPWIPNTHPPRRAPRPPWTALPQAFADAGYSTYGAGITIESFHDSAARCPGCWSDGYFLDWPVNPSTDTFKPNALKSLAPYLRQLGLPDSKWPTLGNLDGGEEGGKRGGGPSRSPKSFEQFIEKKFKNV